MRLGTFINQLQRIDPEMPIRFQCAYIKRKVPEYSLPYMNSIGVGDFYAYRAYYDNLCIEPSKEITRVGDVLAKAKDALGSYFPGYKGGLYKMNVDTPLWCSYYGTASNLYLTEIIVNETEVVIHTKEEPYDYDTGNMPIETILEGIGFGSNKIQYSLDGGESWQETEIEFVYNVLNEYRDCAYFSKDAVHIRGWSARHLCEFVLNIKNHDYIIVKPVGNEETNES